MSVSLKVVKSSFLLLGLQIIQRGLGIVSTLILARLLTPEHFGIVAIVVIALQFFELLVETGNQQYIVQKETISADDLNTAWSMDILAKSGIAFLIIIAAPFIAEFYQTPQLTLALSIASLALPIRALQTPGMMQLAREINYQPIFRLTLWQKGLSFLTTVTIALINPDHWAIIIGNLVSAIVLAAGSYSVNDYRPRWTLKFFHTQWKFSRWLLLRGILGFTRSQIDNLIVSKIFGTVKLGGYNLVRDISLLPALSLIMPMSEPLLAAIAEGKNRPGGIGHRILFSLWVMISVLIPITLFIMSYPELIVRVLLGDQWQAFAHLLQPFGLIFFSYCLFALICDAMIAQGKVKQLFLLDMLSTIIIVAVLLQLGTESLLTMAWVRGVMGVFTTFFYMLVLRAQVSFSLLRILFLCAPVTIGSLSGLMICDWPLFAHSNYFLEFFIKGFVFSIISFAATISLCIIILGNTWEWVQLKSLFQNLLLAHFSK